MVLEGGKAMYNVCFSFMVLEAEEDDRIPANNDGFQVQLSALFQ